MTEIHIEHEGGHHEKELDRAREEQERNERIKKRIDAIKNNLREEIITLGIVPSEIDLVDITKKVLTAVSTLAFDKYNQRRITKEDIKRIIVEHYNIHS